MNSYFFTAETNMKGGATDIANILVQKYTQGKSMTYYGNTLAVCAIEFDGEPVIEGISLISREDVINLKDEKLSKFDGSGFIHTWENPRSI